MAKKRAHRPEGYSPAPHPAARPASASPSPRRTRRTPSGGATPHGATTGARARFEAASRPALLRMQLLPTFVVPVLLAVMLFLGLVVPQPWAGSMLVLIAVFLTWLTAVSWPAITPGSRFLRVAVDLGLLGLGVMRIMGRF